jgi:DNA-binding MarR family transcriptional regulator
VPAFLPSERRAHEVLQGGAVQQVVQGPPVGGVRDQQDLLPVPVAGHVGAATRDPGRPTSAPQRHRGACRRVRGAHIICAVRTEITGGGPALFTLVRYWSRRWTAGLTDADGDTARVGHILILEAIHAAAGGDGPAQIAEVAAELGLDRSNASRMLAGAVDAGLVTKTTSPDDARRAELAITPAGRHLLAGARAWQEHTFARLVTDWPAADARRFATYLVRLAIQPKEPP